MTATVKEDGSAVTVGFDYRGEPYVSREGKVGVATERFYEAESISLEHPGVNAALFIAAKLWIHAKPAWTHGGKPGDSWNCEVVSSGLNVIEYDHTRLIFLHPLPNEVTAELSTPLTKMAFAKSMGNEIMVPTWFINAYDDLDVHYVKRWASVRFITNAELPNVDHVIRFLETEVSYGTVEEILTSKLNQVPADIRETVKEYRDIFEIQLKHITRCLEADHTMKREGIVLNDGGNLIKVVNPLFVEANQYQHAVRNCIKKRTFSNDFPKYFPTCPEPLISDVAALWAKEDRTVVENHTMRVMLYTMQDHYVRAQNQKKLSDPTGLYNNRYPSHAHQATLVAFHAAIESLNGFSGKYN